MNRATPVAAITLPAPLSSIQSVVIDTQIVLDLLLFNDPATALLHAALQAGQLRWLATAHMRNELERVLHYPHIASRIAFYQRQPADILAQRDALAHTLAPAPRCPYICKDPDDQCFIDLAVAEQALLLSKDKQVLKLRKRLAKQGIAVGSQWVDAEMRGLDAEGAKATQKPQKIPEMNI